jgi:hypothetical protein
LHGRKVKIRWLILWLNHLSKLCLWSFEECLEYALQMMWFKKGHNRIVEVYLFIN